MHEAFAWLKYFLRLWLAWDSWCFIFFLWFVNLFWIWVTIWLVREFCTTTCFRIHVASIFFIATENWYQASALHRTCWPSCWNLLTGCRLLGTILMILSFKWHSVQVFFRHRKLVWGKCTVLYRVFVHSFEIRWRHMHAFNCRMLVRKWCSNWVLIAFMAILAECLDPFLLRPKKLAKMRICIMQWPGGLAVSSIWIELRV